ncbi:MAG: thioredoxin domain-containing protein [Flavisolibacter sp.]
MTSHTNRLSKETSPYLLQHAHNPVDWYPWGEEAFEKAQKEDKPILVSIGYSACHWCHVMERESFENPDTAALMNEHFVNIKVDREERPDVDHIYMDAVQAISGSGGWPLNVFLTPDRKPFYGGTYFPPSRVYNRSSWTEVLQAISRAYRENKNDVETQAGNLTEHLRMSNGFGAVLSKESFGQQHVEQAFHSIMKTADAIWGGFGKAPKFPQSFTINFLLDYGFLEQKEEALKQATLSLDKMLQGGIYDQLGGGFARYSTDDQWLAPHFEKMLYDNALLITTLSSAYQLTGNKIYLSVIEETLDFIEHELMQEEGGFFSAFDADSEGEEGRFYVWDESEVKEVLGEDAGLFSEYFDVTEKGNWEGKNILWIRTPLKDFARARNLDPAELQSKLHEGKKKLFQKRSQRVRPALDDKVLLGWNALMNRAFSKAYAATGNPHYRDLALKNMQFLLKAFSKTDGRMHHSWKEGKARHPAFLDDYAFLIAALLDLSEVTAEYGYLGEASGLTEKVLEDFADEASPFFYFTYSLQTDIPVRKKELYDGATPSGNSVMAANLHRLSILLDRKDWGQKAAEMVNATGELAVKYPGSFGIWLSLLYEMIRGTSEIALVGKGWKEGMKELLKCFIPHRLIMASQGPDNSYPLLADKTDSQELLFYLCRNYACLQPVGKMEDFLPLIHSK